MAGGIGGEGEAVGGGLERHGHPHPKAGKSDGQSRKGIRTKGGGRGVHMYIYMHLIAREMTGVRSNGWNEEEAKEGK